MQSSNKNTMRNCHPEKLAAISMLQRIQRSSDRAMVNIAKEIKERLKNRGKEKIIKINTVCRSEGGGWRGLIGGGREMGHL